MPSACPVSWQGTEGLGSSFICLGRAVDLSLENAAKAGG